MEAMSYSVDTPSTSDASSRQTPSPYTNFSRPRLGHRRSYSTGLPFPFVRPDSSRSQWREDTQNTGPHYVDKAIVDAEELYAPRKLQTRDDDMLAYSRGTRADRTGEEDVRNAFRRWVDAEQTRKRFQQPYCVTTEADAQDGQQQPELPPPMPESRVQKPQRPKGPKYEKVDGVVMDTRPGGATGPYDNEDTLPFIEAEDIGEIHKRSAIEEDSVSMSEDELSRLSSLSSTISSSNGSKISPLASGSSGSTSTAPTDNSSLQGYQHVAEQYTSPMVDNDTPAHDGRGGSERYSQESLSHSKTAHDISELDTQHESAARQLHSGPVVAHKLKLEAIDEEAQSITSVSQAEDAAPAPTVGAVQDEEILGHASQPPSTSKHSLTATMNHLTQKLTGDAHDAHDEPPTPPRVLMTNGIGDGDHVYELEATMPAEANVRDTNLSPHVKDGEDDNDDGAAHKPAVLSKVEHGLSKAAHLLHDKVKKTVTFSPVNDVRFMTPSPRASLDARRAGEVNVPQTSL